MSRFLLALLAILAIFSASVSGSMICPQDEEWQNCATACPLTCKNPEPQICTLQCSPGCVCPSGLLRSDSGKCVKPSEC